ncbi:hypothetical protein DM01DRAFT_1339982 [Hesseltinella vesiculosa]|uniref:Phosphatidylinositol-glycan-specific phospholipase D n=1 Tax=Hesseltinella vesiculosa TaxID=101127 RepID=A0A1X2G5A0_9FUNG|nr:hypothetical protein DM01DRAFT_1339982 [Hesseltinella vesiculosa]
MHFSPLVWGCGILVHNEVTARSIELFEPTDTVEHEVRHLLLTYPDYSQPGSFFPDWGYQCLGHDSQAENTHWAPFIKASLEYIRDTYPRPWTDDHVKGLVAFVLGILSHDIADVEWHSLNGLPNYFMQVMASMDFGGDIAKAHKVADTGGEAVLRHRSRLDYLSDQWKLPLDDLIRIYQRYYQQRPGAVPPADHVRYCMMRAFAGIKLDVGLVKYLFDFYGAQSPFLVDHMYDYHRGGIQDMAASVTNCYSQAIEILVSGPTNGPLCGSYFDNDVGSRRQHQPRHTSRHQQVLHLPGNSTEEEEWLEQVKATGGDSGVWTIALVNENEAAADDDRTIGSNDEGVLVQQQCATLDSGDRRVDLTIDSSLAGFGHAMVVGDFHGDGRKELVISAPYDGRQDRVMAGSVFVANEQSWKNDQAGFDTHNSTDQYSKHPAWSVSLRGRVAGSRFGWALAVVDLNADGIDDLAVASPFANGGGHVDVYFGQRGVGLASHHHQSLNSTLSWDLDGYGSVLKGVDLDGDGFKDLWVGCPYCSTPQGGAQAGLAQIHYSSRSPVETMSSPSPMPFEHFGWAMTYFATTDMILVGAPGAAYQGPQVGKVHAFKGGVAYWSMTGNSVFGQFGSVLEQWQEKWLIVSSPTEVKRAKRVDGHGLFTHTSALIGRSFAGFLQCELPFLFDRP